MNKEENLHKSSKQKVIRIETNGVNLRIYKKIYRNRDNQLSKNYYGRWSKNNIEKEISSGESDLKLAKKKLIEEVIGTNIRLNQGLTITRQKFNASWEKFYNDKENQSLSKSWYETIYKRGLILKKYFNNIEVARINKDKIQSFINQRKVVLNNKGNKLSNFTVKNDISVLRKFLNWCLEEKIITKKVTIKTSWIVSSKHFQTQRTYFTKNEWDIIRKQNLKEIKETDNIRLKFRKQYLHSLMLFLINTGMRLSEVYQMKWSDCSLIEGKTQSDFRVRVRIGAETKTGERSVTGFSGAYFSLVNLKNNFENYHQKKLDINSETLVFSQRCVTGFNSLLKRCNLKYKTQGSRTLTRDLTTFRHTFIVWGLHRGWDIFKIHKHCGTSIQMIESHYARYLETDLLKDKLSGWGNLKSLS